MKSLSLGKNKMTNKKVIFIGGTSFSGSTLLDMILANDTRGFSCGELYALFHPFRRHHINPICGCGDTDCKIWELVLKNGEKSIVDTILSLFPTIEYLVISSKNPFWIKSQMVYLEEQSVDYENILIWKTPLEFYQSYEKRGLKNWEKNWVDYHRLYFSVIKNWKAVKYKDLVQKQGTLEKVCDQLGIKYFDGKEIFWEKKHHTLFGNTSAKLHLRENNTKNLDEYRTIYYEAIDEEKMKKNIATITNNTYITQILNNLNLFDVSNYNSSNISDIKLELPLSSRLFKKSIYNLRKYLGILRRLYV
jgi:hypothetical protein